MLLGFRYLQFNILYENYQLHLASHLERVAIKNRIYHLQFPTACEVVPYTEHVFKRRVPTCFLMLRPIYSLIQAPKILLNIY
jgi:hypothetical protein